MQNVDYLQSRECAYVVTALTGENAKKAMDSFNKATMGLE